MDNKMKETWKTIPGWSEYQVSDRGRVKSLKRGKERILKLSYNQGYLIVGLWDKCQKTIKVHQLVAMAFLGHKPNGMKLTVDHINGVKDDNRLENIRIVTALENLLLYYRQNPGTSKHLGVYWHKKSGKWMAKIQVNKKYIYLGLYVCEDKAAKAYQNAFKTYRDGSSK